MKSGKEQPVYRYHPWIFSGAIKNIYGSPKEGDVVDVYDNKENFLATGHYQPGSIAVRILTFKEVDPDVEFFRERIRNAISYRKSLGFTNNSDTNVFRLVHAEGDDLSGLIIDYYNGVAVMQCHSVGMYRLRNELAQILRDLPGEKLTAIYDKSAETIPHMSGISAVNEYLFGNQGPATGY